jgi:hypothetical protein
MKSAWTENLGSNLRAGVMSCGDSPTERIITLRITSERITSERINTERITSERINLNVKILNV